MVKIGTVGRDANSLPPDEFSARYLFGGNGEYLLGTGIVCVLEYQTTPYIHRYTWRLRTFQNMKRLAPNFGQKINQTLLDRPKISSGIDWDGLFELKMQS